MHRFRSALASLAVPALLAPWAAASAQDTRTVTEPRIPAACATLDAALVPVGDTTLADADERRLDTERVQRAIDGCGAGRAVVLRARGAQRAFVSGPLTLKTGVTLVVDSGAVLFASRDPEVFAVTAGSCGVLAPNGRGCRPLISVTKAPHAGVMGAGTIDGRGWAPLLGRGVSWWDLAQQARNTKLSQNCPRLIVASGSDDFTLYRITLRSSPNFHVVYEKGDGFTAWGVRIDTPQPNARNTDGIDPSAARNVTITRSWILAGDDNVALKGGNGPMTNVTVSDSHFYRGHGMSIGSETNAGVDRLYVHDLTIDGADDGIRIKSNAARGGLVTHATYERVCIRRTKEPIVFDTHYSASPETTGTLIPEFRDIVLRDVHIFDGGKITLDGYDAARPLGITLDGVTVQDPSTVKLTAAHVAVTVGPNGANLPLAGDDVRVTGQEIRKDTPQAPNACADKFVPFPTR